MPTGTGEGATLTARYEQLRAAVLDGAGNGLRLGLGVLACHGMAAWMNAWQRTPPTPQLPAPRRPEPAQPSPDGAGDLVRVLAAMALAHI
jgi:hypothetical protein